MSKRKRGDPYDVGFAKPPIRTRFKKGVSGNPRGRPPKKPDVYAELMAVLQEKVTVTIEYETREVTVQQALLLRLRQEANLGRVWASKLVLRVIAAMPEGMSPIDAQVRSFEQHLRLQTLASKIVFRQNVSPEMGKRDG